MSYITFLRVDRNGHPTVYVQIEGQSYAVCLTLQVRLDADRPRSSHSEK